MIGRRRKRGGDFVAQTLSRLGIRHLFSVPGAQTLSIWDATHRFGGPALVIPRSEWDAGFMAEGYAAASGLPAVVTNTIGPGVANEMVAMASARTSRSPVLFVSPCHPPEKRERASIGAVFQGLDQASFYGEIPLETVVVDEAEDLGARLVTGLAYCKAARGPVRVDVSFPLLFERHRFVPVPEQPSEPPREASAILVHEVAPSAPQPPPPWLPGNVTQIAPGHGEGGYGVPFGLGARFSRDDIPTVVLTSSQLLIDGAGSVSLARWHGIAVNVAFQGEGGQHPFLEDLARAFQARYLHRPDPHTLASVVASDRRALTFVCA